MPFLSANHFCSDVCKPHPTCCAVHRWTTCLLPAWAQHFDTAPIKRPWQDATVRICAYDELCSRIAVDRRLLSTAGARRRAVYFGVALSVFMLNLPLRANACLITTARRCRDTYKVPTLRLLVLCALHALAECLGVQGRASRNLQVTAAPLQHPLHTPDLHLHRMISCPATAKL